jgi:peptidylprolyl isomerase
MDLESSSYTRQGTAFDRGTVPGVVLDERRLPAWKFEGLAGIRPRERRRLLVPAALIAAGTRGRGGARPPIDTIVDVRRVQLEIVDVQIGQGPEVKRGTVVLCHYRGTLADGTEFDSSYKRDEPFTVRLPANPSAPAGVIEGWARGLIGMRAGGIRKLWIPSHLAYKEQGSGKIPPNADLTFVIEVLSVTPM